MNAEASVAGLRRPAEQSNPAELTIVNPVALQKLETREGERFPSAPRLTTFAGKTVGLYWNGKQQGEHALARTREQLARLYPDVKFREYIGSMGGVLRRASDEQLDQMARECDAVIGTTADCGSCTSWLIHDMCHVERRGKPALAWTAEQFVEDAHWSANVWGVPDLAIACVPECFTNNSPDRIRHMVDASWDNVIRAFTQPPLAATLDFKRITRDNVTERELVYRGADPMESWEAMNRAFLKAGWSDGFPLIAPTPAKVAAMVEGAKLPGDHIVGYLEPGFGIATVEKIAANAAMAGCTPAMMPLLIAVVDCLLDSRSGFRGVCMSTGPQAPVIMVSGAVVEELGLNYGIAPIGPGSQNAANISIGRAVRLIMMNVGLSYPGVSDMDTHGTTMKFSYCVAENEARNPWEPHRVVRGFSRESSTVTVNSPFSQTVLHDFYNHDPKKLVEVFCSTMVGMGSPMSAYWLISTKGPDTAPAVWRGDPDNLLFLCPDHAALFKRAGWTLNDLKQALYDGCRVSFREAMLNKQPELFKHSLPHMQWLWDQPETQISIFGSPDNFDIFVTGGDAGWSTWHDGGTYSITREIGSVGRQTRPAIT